MNTVRLPICALLSIAACLLMSGCGGGGSEAEQATSTESDSTSGNNESETRVTPQPRPQPIPDTTPLVLGGGTAGPTPGMPPQPSTGPLVLGNPPTTGTPNTPAGTDGPGEATGSDDSRADQITAALKPLQIWLGDWRGILNKTKSYEESAWVWDFKSDRNQPALVMSVPNGKHFQETRITWLPESKEFQLSMTDDDQTTVYKGSFSEPVRNTPDDNNKPQRTFKLKLNEVTPEKDGSELVFNQVDNNRYRVELYDRKPSGRVLLVDTIGSQRQNTSFAKSDSDYGDRECIISQGLGTTAVSFMGKTYYVCCSGCAAAFNDDPEYWIAKAEKRKAEEAN